MLLSLFIVSVFILVISEAAEDKKRKKRQNMTLRNFLQKTKSGKSKK